MFWEIVLTSLALMVGIMIAGEIIEYLIRRRKG